MPLIDATIGSDVSEDTRGKKQIWRKLIQITNQSLVLGYDPLIPPVLLQTEVPAVLYPRLPDIPVCLYSLERGLDQDGTQGAQGMH